MQTKLIVCRTPPRGCIDSMPCSFAQAITLPVSVAAPIMALAAPAVYIWMRATSPIIAGERTAAAATKAEAPPPNPLKRATSSGMAVRGTLSAAATPTTEPMAMPTRMSSKLTICRTSNVAVTAISIPVAPSKFPRRAVRGDVSPLRPRMNRTEATR